jgi:hypothetical protein
MNASDKFTGKWRPAAKPRQRWCTLLECRTENKTISRTRKEKCQTRTSRCRAQAPCRRPTATIFGFQLRFTLLLHPDSSGQPPSRLTYLTVACQKCQTQFGTATASWLCSRLLARRRRRRVGTPECSPTSPPANPSCGTPSSPTTSSNDRTVDLVGRDRGSVLLRLHEVIVSARSWMAGPSSCERLPRGNAPPCNRHPHRTCRFRSCRGAVS